MGGNHVKRLYAARHPLAFHSTRYVLTDKHHAGIIGVSVSTIKDEAEFARYTVLDFVKERLLDWRRFEHRWLSRLFRIISSEAARYAVNRKDEVIPCVTQLKPLMLARQRDGLKPILLTGKSRGTTRIPIVVLALPDNATDLSRFF